MALSLLWAWVPSLLGELRSHNPQGANTETNKQRLDLMNIFMDCYHHHNQGNKHIPHLQKISYVPLFSFSFNPCIIVLCHCFWLICYSAIVNRHSYAAGLYHMVISEVPLRPSFPHGPWEAGWAHALQSKHCSMERVWYWGGEGVRNSVSPRGYICSASSAHFFLRNKLPNPDLPQALSCVIKSPDPCFTAS